MSLLAEPWFDFASFAFERLLHFYSDSPQIPNLLFQWRRRHLTVRFTRSAAK